MSKLLQSTARDKMVFMADSADHVTGKTGLTLTITASKNGGAFASISPTVTARGDGWYSLALTTSHTDTLGDLALHITSSGADPTDVVWEVIAFNLSTATQPVNVTQIGGDTQSATDLKDFADAGYDPSTNKVQGVVLVDTLTTYTGNTVQTGDSYARIGANGASLSAIPWNSSWDAEVQSECTDALNAYDPPTNTEMVAAFTEIKGATWASTDTLEAIRDRGDAAWVTSTFSITASAIASQVRTELTTELGRIDAAITTRASQTSVDDVPTNSELTTALADLPTNSELTTALADLPTVAEFEARTIVAANYFDSASDTVLLAAATCNKIADHVRRRTQANVEASSDGDTLGYSSEYGMIQQAQESNTVDNAGKLTVYKTDGTTELAQRTLTTDDTAEPITGIE